jgi:hypothetical protein
VYRIDSLNAIDTFSLSNILFPGGTNNSNQYITDDGGDFGYYGSYLNNCDNVFDWISNRDTLSNFIILKSREDVCGCHKGDPNVKIDQLTFVHKGSIINKNESIQINK